MREGDIAKEILKNVENKIGSGYCTDVPLLLIAQELRDIIDYKSTVISLETIGIAQATVATLVASSLQRNNDIEQLNKIVKLIVKSNIQERPALKNQQPSTHVGKVKQERDNRIIEKT